MSKKFWLIVLIIVILAGVLYWYFNYSAKSSPPETAEEQVEPKEKSFQTIELEKPPFINPVGQ